MRQYSDKCRWALEEVDGGSFVHLIHGTADKPVARAAGGLVFHRPRQRESVYAKGDHKLLLKWREETPDKASLYNTRIDAAESKDLAAQQPERVAAMKKSLLAYLKSVKAETVNDVPKKRIGY